jgi:hypothetical protein
MEDEEGTRAAESPEARMLRLILRSMGEGVLVTDTTGKIVEVNRAMVALLRAEGLPLDEFRVTYQTFTLDGRLLAPEELPSARALRGESADDIEMIVRSSRLPEEMLVNVGIRPVTDEEGELLGGIVVFSDVTERKRAEADREKLETRLRQTERLESIGQLAGGIAHDFNNLLAGIMNYASLAASNLQQMRAGEAPGEARDKIGQVLSDVDQITRAAKRAADLTHRLLVFARREVVKPEVLNLNHVVAEMEELVRRTIGEHIHLTTRLDPTLSNIKADRSQLEQVFMNLAINARDAMKNGGTLLIETQSADIDGSSVGFDSQARVGLYSSLVVADTGAGMSKEVAGRVFEPFFTTKEKGMGTGMGLATVYGIVSQAGGHIHLYSEPGRGTTFKVYFPVTGGEPGPRREAARDLPAARGEIILLVEDEEMVREPTQRLLTRAGYDVIAFASGLKALEHFRGRPAGPQLLLTDVVMPDISGRELALRVQELYPETKVLYMSGYSQELSGVEVKDLLLLEKPFTQEGLLRKIREALG